MKTVFIFFCLLTQLTLQEEIRKVPNRPKNLTIVTNAKPFREPPPINKNKNTEIYLTKYSQLNSYHPHYLISYSYPYPMTPHFYFAEIVGTDAIVHAKDFDRWDPNTISRLSVNGVRYEDKSAKYYKFQREETFRYMLVLQMESSYTDARQYSINVFKRNDHFLAVTQYDNKYNAFLIYLTKASEILPLDFQSIKINLRNESRGDTKSNWRFSSQLQWKGNNVNVNQKETNFVGLVLEIQYIDKKKDIILNLHQISNPGNLSLTQFAKSVQQLKMEQFLPTPKTVMKNSNCTNAAIQKILEGLSFQYGDLKIKDGTQILANEPKPLLSFSPSRKRFPWGFLWDDGFHCQVAVRKNQALTLKVIKSWLDTMLQSGWIPRQQNRGAERQQLCSCPRFMEKDVKDGNPPTLLLALQYLLKQKKLNPDVLQVQYWVKIKRWYSWFINSQRDDKSFLFKWKDSINQQGASFTSGMDDFPRPHNCKANVDLQSWMYFFTNFMVRVAPIYSQDNSQYINNLQQIKQGFKQLVEEKSKLYKDVSLDGSFSQHFGYPNILPIAFGIPQFQSSQYNATIGAVKSELDINAGLASISKSSPFYLQSKDAYWKGPVWINLNYLFLRGLKLHYPKETQLYKKIRSNIVETVCGNWMNSGYFYQNYIQGKGSFSYPFNGWTSLISIIAEQNY